MSAIWRNSISIVVEVVFDFDLPSFGMCLLNQKKSEHFWLLVSSLLIVRISDSWPSPDFFRFNFSFVRISKRLASLDLSLSHFGNEQKTFYKPQARNHSADWRSSPCWHHVYWTIPVSGQTVNNAHRTLWRCHCSWRDREWFRFQSVLSDRLAEAVNGLLCVYQLPISIGCRRLLAKLPSVFCSRIFSWVSFESDCLKLFEKNLYRELLQWGSLAEEAEFEFPNHQERFELFEAKNRMLYTRLCCRLCRLVQALLETHRKSWTVFETFWRTQTNSEI